METFFYWDETIKKIMNEKQIFIYGAGMMGNSLYHCLTGKPYYKSISGFIVNKKENNPDQIDGIPVMDLAEGRKYRECLVLIALHEEHIDAVVADLSREHYVNLLLITFDSDAWCHIRGNWFRAEMKESMIGYLDSEIPAKYQIYVVCSDNDKTLENIMPIREFEKLIQVGAALTETWLCPLRDDIGENISAKNHKYCELTALYWVWKHDNSAYVGISHYRRRFRISEREVEKMALSDIDMVVTIPILNLPGVKQQYGMDHDLSDWEIMSDILGELYPEYVSALEKVECGNYYFGYNMFLAKRPVFERYCEWLFPILEKCEERIGNKEDAYQNRYIGFLAERLLTVFLEKNQHLRVAVSDKHFIER